MLYNSIIVFLGSTRDGHLSVGSTRFFLRNRLFTWLKLDTRGKSTLQLPYANEAKFLLNWCSCKRPPPVSDHPGFAFLVVAYGRFNCIFFTSLPDRSGKRSAIFTQARGYNYATYRGPEFFMASDRCLSHFSKSLTGPLSPPPVRHICWGEFRFLLRRPP